MNEKPRSNRFKQVGVLMGGPSAERDVSLASGQAVAEALAEAGFEVTPLILDGRLESLPNEVEAVFIALHGQYGEDGQLQEDLDRMKRPYTGSTAVASRLAFDKEASKNAFLKAGIQTPEWKMARPGEPCPVALPAVAKPPREGSSIGLHFLNVPSDWSQLEGEEALIVERYIPGRELTVGIVDGETLPVLEIMAPEGRYDYHAKYTRGTTQYACPAQLDDEVESRARQMALEVFNTLGCSDLSRVDFRLDTDGELWVLELNSIPGFTATSLLPKAAAVAGMDFPALCARIMNLASFTG